MPSVQQASHRKSDKQFRDQLMIVGKERDKNGTRKLRAVATSMYDEAMNGNVTAQVAIRDTMDGKPAQAVSVEGYVDHRHTLVMDDGEMARRLALALYRADKGLDMVDVTPLIVQGESST